MHFENNFILKNGEIKKNVKIPFFVLIDGDSLKT